MPEDPRILTRKEKAERIAGDLHDAIHDAACLVDFEGRTIGWAPEDSIPLIKAALLKFSDDEQTAQRERIATLEEKFRLLECALKISAADANARMNEGNELRADNRRLQEALTEIGVTCVNEGAEGDQRKCVEIYKSADQWCCGCIVHSALQPAAPQLSGTSGEMEGR